jgi:hypothetical protein
LGRDAAVRFAFMMSLPITAGALVYKAVDLNAEGGIPADMRVAFGCGIVSSAVTGYIAVWGILKLVRNRSFASFVLYRLVLGLAVLAAVAAPFRWPGEVDELVEVAIQEPKVKLRGATGCGAAVAASGGGEAGSDAADVAELTADLFG